MYSALIENHAADLTVGLAETVISDKPALQVVLERLVREEEFRKQLLADPEYLFQGFGLTPGEVGLLIATAEAAYGSSESLAGFQHRMCAVTADE